MRSFDPRLWNLLPTTALLAAACGPPGIPVDESFGDGFDELEGTASSDEVGPECTVDTDCTQGYYCAGEVCQPVPYTDYSDYSDWEDTYTDYSDYSDYADNYTDYSDYSDWADSYPGCYTDYDCPPNYVCTYGYCSPSPPPYNPEPVECDSPAVVEIPLPSLGTVVDLQLADVDGDADDELVALLDGGIAVVQDDDTVVMSPWPAPPSATLAQLAMVSLDSDTTIDLVAFPNALAHATVALGDGAGNFAVLGAMASPSLVQGPLGFDGELDGIDRVLALRTDVDRITQFSDPLLLSGNNFLFGPAGASDLDLLKFGPFAHQVLIGVVCAASLRAGPDLGALAFLDDPLIPGVLSCDWHGAAFIDGTDDQPLLLVRQQDTSVLRRYDVPADLAFQIQVPISPTSSVVANLDGTGDFVLMTNPGLGRVTWGWTDDDPGCIGTLPFVGTLDFAVGDRNGDGSQDVATLDEMGVLRLWSVL